MLKGGERTSCIDEQQLQPKSPGRSLHLLCFGRGWSGCGDKRLLPVHRLLFGHAKNAIGGARSTQS